MAALLLLCACGGPAGPCSAITDACTCMATSSCRAVTEACFCPSCGGVQQECFCGGGRFLSCQAK